MLDKNLKIGDKIKFSQYVTANIYNKKYKYDSIEFVVTNVSKSERLFGNGEYLEYKLLVVKSQSSQYPAGNNITSNNDEHNYYDFVTERLHNHPLTSMFKNVSPNLT